MNNNKYLEKIAKNLSHLLNPASLALMLFAGLGGYGGVGWRVGAMALYGLGPAFILLWLFRRGTISQLYLPERLQRLRVLQWGALYYGLCTGLLWLASAPAVVIAAGQGICLMVVGVWLINHFWKISIHATGVAGSVVIALSAGGPRLWPLLIAVPLIVWARLYLRAHTVGQVLAGLILGAVSAWMTFGQG